MNNDFMVSVAILTYNHAKTIERCLESVCKQRLSQRFEVIVHDDASSDLTVDLIQEFAKRSSVKIKLIEKAENVGVSASFYDLLSACNGKYIALCEGDDYWIDDSKLEIQVTFLEQNSTCIMCHHRVFFETDSGRYLSSQSGEITGKQRLRAYLSSRPCPHTCSIMIRNKDSLMNPPECFYKLNCQDAVLTLMCCTYGDIRFIDRIMSVYSFTGDGVYSGASVVQRLRFLIEFNQAVVRYYPEARISYTFISTYIRELVHYWKVEDSVTHSWPDKLRIIAATGPIGLAYYFYVVLRSKFS
jgi:glycosyltransferase involved in cell wall biosynthesis